LPCNFDSNSNLGFTLSLHFTDMATDNSNGEARAVGSEKINTDIITLTRFLTEEQTKHKEATGDFT